jgi:Flp pilus assembly protein CpaB
VKRSNRLVILVGVLLAVLAFVGIVILLNQRGAAPTEVATPQTEVLIANRDIAIGEAVTPEMVDLTEVDPEDVVGTSLGDPSLVANRPALVAVPEGAQVHAAVFGQIGIEDIDIVGQLQPGEKAVAFQVDRLSGLDFLVQQGDFIDIVLEQRIQVLQPTVESAAAPDQAQRFEVVTGLENARTVKTVIQNRRVLYVSESRIPPETAPAASPTPTPVPGTAEAEAAQVIERVIIVFAGTDVDAELIKFMQRDSGEIGALTVTLRSPDDDAEETTTGLTIDLLVETYGVPVPGILESLSDETTPQ